MLSCERPTDHTWLHSSWQPLFELDVRGAYARLVLTSSPRSWRRVPNVEPSYRRWPRYAALTTHQEGDNSNNDSTWSWSVIFAENAHEVARSRCMLWWRVLHDRWQSTERVQRWQADESGWCSVCSEGTLGTTAHVFLECAEALRVWHWLRDLWRKLTDGGELRCDARAVLSGFALPAVRAWRRLRRLRLALFIECFGAIADAQQQACRARREQRGGDDAREFRVAPLVLARRAVRERVQKEFEAARVKSEVAMLAFRSSWAHRQVICIVSESGKLQVNLI